MRLLGAILAGGRATRFGSDKALAVLDGRPLIAHAADVVHEMASKIVVCGRDVAPEGMETIPDWPTPDLGPLGGLCGALRYAAAHEFDAVLTIGCDTPVLPAGLLDRLTNSGGASFVRQTPIIGYWPTQPRRLSRPAPVAGRRSIGAALGHRAPGRSRSTPAKTSRISTHADDLDQFVQSAASAREFRR